MKEVKVTVNFEGEVIEALSQTYSKCPKCGELTYFESEYVYADNPYDREFCTCGWWANTIMDSDDL